MSVPISDIYAHIDRLDRAASHTEEDRKQAGITYTPLSVVRGMIELLAPQEHEVVHEPSCGRGMFVFGLVEYWLNHNKTPLWIASWAKDHLICNDLDAQAVDDLNTLWVEWFKQHNIETSPIAVVQDGLFGSLAQQSVNVVVGNPPYVRLQNLPEDIRENIRQKYETCQRGNVDLYYAFFEDALHRAKRVCYIMPNSWLTNRSAKLLRQTALSQLSHLIDYGSHLLFAPVRAYTAIVLTQANIAPEEPIAVRAALPNENDRDWLSIPRDDEKWSDERFRPLGETLLESQQNLGDIAQVFGGIATLSDSSFILPNPRVVEKTINGKTERWVEQEDPLRSGTTLCIPERFAPVLIKTTKGEKQVGKVRILCPYDDQWNIVSEEELHLQAPDLLSWLEHRKDKLSQRDRGKKTYEAWYAYGRRQGFHSVLTGEQIILLPQMGNGALQPFILDTQKIGRFIITSGYGIRLLNAATNHQSLKDIQTVLKSTDTWNYVKEKGKMWAGEGDYRTIGAREVRLIPLHPIL